MINRSESLADRSLRLPLRQQHRRHRRRRGAWPSSPRACPASRWPGTTSTCVPIPARNWSSGTFSELNLNRIVVAACSPNLHEPTFRRAAERRRPEPLSGADGQHPRAGRLGHRGCGERAREGQGASWRRPSAAWPATSRCSGSSCRSGPARWSSAAGSPGSRPP